MSKRIDNLVHNQKYSIMHGAAGSLPNAFVSTYVSMFAISVLDASNYQVALLSSLPQILGVISVIPAAMWVNRAESKKKLTMYSTFLARVILFTMIFVPFLPEERGSGWFVIMVGIMNIPFMFSVMSWQAFIADLVPEKSRALFFAKRNRILTLSSMISMTSIGILMFNQDPSNPLPYQIIILICTASAIFEVLSIKKHIEIPVSKEQEQKEKVSIFSKKVFTHKPYTVFLICALAYNFAWQMAWPLFSIYNVTYCEANLFWISIFSVCNQIAQFIFFPIWGRLARKYPISVLLVVNALGMAVSSALWMLSTNLIWVSAMNMVSGIFVSGTMLLLFNGLLESSRQDMKTTFVANYNFLLGFVAFLAPQFGAFLLEFLTIQQSIWVSSGLRVIVAGMFVVMTIYLKRLKEQELDGQSVGV